MSKYSEKESVMASLGMIVLIFFSYLLFLFLADRSNSTEIYKNNPPEVIKERELNKFEKRFLYYTETKGNNGYYTEDITAAILVLAETIDEKGIVLEKDE